MSLTNNTSPANVVLSHNIVPLILSTDKYYLSLGTKQVIKIIFGVNTTAGKTITITWKEFSMVLTFAASPDDTGMQLPLYNTAVSNGFDDLIAALKTNYYFNRYFVFSSVVTHPLAYLLTVTLTQREYGQDFAATAAAGDDGTNFIPTIDVAQVQPTYSPNFRVLCDMYWQPSGTGAQNSNYLIAQLDATTDELQLPEFNLNGVFKKWSELSPDFPLSTDTDTDQCANVLQNYWLRVSESYGSPEQVKMNVMYPALPAANNYLQVILGGMPFLSYPGNTFYADYCNATYNKFLTTMVSGATTVNREMFHALYFYTKTTYTSIHIKGKLYLSDGTSVNITGGNVTPVQKTVNKAAVGFTQLGLGSLLGGLDPVKYEVWIEDDGDVRITEKFTFLVDDRYCEYNNYLYFHNSLGGVDTVWLTGFCAPVPVQVGDELVMAVENTYTEGNIIASNSRTRQAWEMNTGYKQIKGEIDHLLELMQSNHVKWLPDAKVRPNATEPINVVITKGSAKNWPADEDDIFALSFKLQEGHYEY